MSGLGSVPIKLNSQKQGQLDLDKGLSLSAPGLVQEKQFTESFEPILDEKTNLWGFESELWLHLERR